MMQARRRDRRSSVRTIIQLNSHQKKVNDRRLDPKEFWSEKKCHKYAMFKVIILNLILLIFTVAFLYNRLSIFRMKIPKQNARN